MSNVVEVEEEVSKGREGSSVTIIVTVIQSLV